MNLVVHGLDASNTYRYYLIRLGHSAIAVACSITRFNIIPAMAQTV